jgi:hypothetical protein
MIGFTNDVPPARTIVAGALGGGPATDRGGCESAEGPGDHLHMPSATSMIASAAPAEMPTTFTAPVPDDPRRDSISDSEMDSAGKAARDSAASASKVPSTSGGGTTTSDAIANSGNDLDVDESFPEIVSLARPTHDGESKGPLNKESSPRRSCRLARKPGGADNPNWKFAARGGGIFSDGGGGSSTVVNGASAAMTSSGNWYRSAGLFFIIRSTIWINSAGTSDRSETIGRGSSLWCRNSFCITVPGPVGSAPVRRKYAEQPRL